jgi:hypothetical protein
MYAKEQMQINPSVEDRDSEHILAGQTDFKIK